MKSQLKTIVGEQIASLEWDKVTTKSLIRVFYEHCDIEDKSSNSLIYFKSLNIEKTRLRKIDDKLRKLRVLQNEIKHLVSTTTLNSSVVGNASTVTSVTRVY